MSEGPSITADAEDDFLLLSNREDAEVHANISSVSPRICGRLRAHLPAWEYIGASDFVLNVISHGFKLPFITEPAELLLPNHSSALEYSVFVTQAVQTLLDNGSAVEVDRDQVYICSPLGVVPKKNGKLRLILDLRYLCWTHTYIHVCTADQTSLLSSLFMVNHLYDQLLINLNGHNNPTAKGGCTMSLQEHESD